MALSNDDLGSTAFFNPGWIAANGGWIHSNNVLFYFMESPFFDRTSTNQSVVTQNTGIPEREYAFLSTRKKFEHALSMLIGLQYLVAYDPLELNVKVDGPTGQEQSDIWVIRKQYRRKTDGSDDDVDIRAYYYIINQTIYQAPSVANVLTYRMLNTALAINTLFSTASSLPIFTASHGHTYQRPTQKITSSTAAALQPSKENTPMPDTRVGTGAGAGAALGTAAEKGASVAEKKVPADSSAKTLYDALQMTLRYSKEYMDDMPLVGEPGNFRFTKVKDTSATTTAAAAAAAAAGQLRGQSLKLPPSKAATPAPQSRAASPPPAIQTDVPPVMSKKSSAKSPGSNDPMKPKRRKSKATNQSP